MTGYGRASCEVGGHRYVVELRSVNHRFLEIKQRLPWPDGEIELLIAQLLRQKFDRGVISVAIRDEGGTANSLVQADVALARSYATALHQLRQALSLDQPVTLELIAAQPGVLRIGDDSIGHDEKWRQLKAGIEQAIAALLEARQREGTALTVDLSARVATLERLAIELRALAHDTPEHFRKRLQARVEAVAKEVDQIRVAQEVAILVDKMDVAEELTRLDTHISETKRLLGETLPVGRRLDFLTQEMHREVNTIGAKAQSGPIAGRVVDAKVEIERLREQIQNVE